MEDHSVIITSALMAHVNFCPPLGLVYMMNPKAACSTIKQSMWKRCDTLKGTQTYPGNPHQDRARAPFLYAASPANICPDHAGAFRQATVFTAVRNPYVRVLSSYLDKIKRPDRERLVWPFFSQIFGLALDSRPSFLEFLNLLRIENPYLLDRHFAPQWVNVLSSAITFDRIFFVEEFEALRSFLVSSGVDVHDFNLHATSAADSLGAYYGKDELEAVRDIYRRDFELFGYDMDIRNLRPNRPEINGKSDTTILEDVMTVFSSVPKAEKKHRLEALVARLPSTDADYLNFAAIGLSFEEKIAVAANLAEAGSANWRYLSELGADLARVGAMGAAVPLLRLANQIQKKRLRHL